MTQSLVFSPPRLPMVSATMGSFSNSFFDILIRTL
jgi:hypothetical protein